MSEAPGSPEETLLKQAYEQLAEGGFEQAVETFSAVLAVSPKQAQALRGRGLAFQQLKQYAQATSDFRKACELTPADLDAQVDLAASLGQSDQVYPALEVFDALLAAHPDFARGHIEVGLLHLRLGAIPKGREHLTQALACRPTLTQRRFIQGILTEQDRLDRKRYYRPDFEALHREKRGMPWMVWMGKTFQAIKQAVGRGKP